MPYIDLGKVRGEDGTIGNISTDYINDGGDPGVDIVRSGSDSSPDLTFEFKNLVNDPLSASDVESICAGNTVHTSNVVNGTVLSNFFSGIKSAFNNLFAPKTHTHNASDITAGQLAASLLANGIITEDMLADACVTEAKLAEGAVTTDKIAENAVTSDKIADHSVGENQLDEEVWETLSQATKIVNGYTTFYVYETIRMVIAHIAISTSIAAGANIDAGNFPAAYAPEIEVDAPLYINQKSDSAYAWINANGTSVTVRSMVAGQVYGTMLWHY